MKNLSKVLALVLVVAMVFSLAVSASAATSFTDDADIDYSEGVELLTSLGVISGYPDGSFQPDRTITRAEVSTLISYIVSNSRSETPLYSDINKLNSDYASLCTFADSKNHWAAGFIAFCASNGYISGHNANTFDPAGVITGAQLATILLRVMGYDATIENMGTVAGTANAANTLRLAGSAGLTTGLPTNFNFFGSLTRQEAAQMILNMLNGIAVAYNTTGSNMVITNPDGSSVVITGNSERYYVTTGTGAQNDPIVYVTMMSKFFRGVEKDTDVINGVSGYYWVDTANNNAKLTDFVATDNITATYEGGTSLDAIARELGISRTDAYITEAWYNNYEHNGGNLSINTMLGTGSTLSDDSTLSVVKNGNNDFKFILTIESVAKVEKSSRPITTAGADYGKYTYRFYANSSLVATVNAADGTYVDGAYYVVAPYKTGYASIDGTRAPFSVSAAEVVANVVATSAQADSVTSATYFNVGTTRYYKSVGAYVEANVAPTVSGKEAFTAVLNSAGYVAVFAAADSTVATTASGYVYVDLDNYQVTTTNSSLIDGSAYTWSAVAKARAYFANEATATIIDLKVDTTSANGRVTGASIGNQKIWGEDVGENQNDVYGNVTSSLGLKGFYRYVQYEDGTYGLTAVDMSTAGTKTGASFSYNDQGAKTATVTSATTATVYTFTGASLTSQTLTGYRNIADGAYQSYTVNNVGVVTTLSRFVEPTAGAATYAYYAGAGDYVAGIGATLKFYVNGEAVSYKDSTGGDFSGAQTGDIYSLELSGGEITNAVKASTLPNVTIVSGKDVWTVGNGYIVFSDAQTTAIPVASDYVVYDATATGNGAEADLHLDDTVTYVTVNGEIAIVWITAYAN